MGGDAAKAGQPDVATDTAPGAHRRHPFQERQDFARFLENDPALVRQLRAGFLADREGDPERTLESVQREADRGLGPPELRRGAAQAPGGPDGDQDLQLGYAGELAGGIGHRLGL
jgi:hypothetical protein